MFAKRLSQLEWRDIQAVVDSGTPEDEHVEFKAALSARNGEDRWPEKNQISDQAKASIAKEIVAFANSAGGTLILGISEDGSGRAESIQLIPKCKALAEQLARSIVSCTDPKLLGLEYVGVERDGDSGVVVLRVPPSPRAPHCDRFSRLCHRRVGANSDQMDMASIQMASVESWKGTEQVVERLKSRTLEFDSHFLKSFERPSGSSKGIWRAGCRATAFPLERLRIKDISRNDLYRFRNPGLRLKTQPEQYWYRPESLSWKPTLRGLRARIEDVDWMCFEEFTILHDGLFEVKAVYAEHYDPEDGDSSRHLYVDKFLKAFCRFFVMVEVFRDVLGRPDQEFALSLEWKVPPHAATQLSEPTWRGIQKLRAVEPVNVLDDIEFPSLENLDSFWGYVESEFFNSFGIASDRRFPVDFSSAIQEVKRDAFAKLL